MVTIGQIETVGIKARYFPATLRVNMTFRMQADLGFVFAVEIINVVLFR